MLKEQIKKIREERGGFTLAELLIVVAIILVLVAVAIPVFTSALHNARFSADEANARSLYADLTADYIANEEVTSSAAAGDYTDTDIIITEADGSSNTYTISADTTVTIAFDNDGRPSVSITDNRSGCSNDAHGDRTFGE